MASAFEASAGEDGSSIDAVAEFCKVTGLQVRSAVVSKSYTTFCIGGALQYFVELNNETEVVAAVKCLRNFGLNYRVIGGGSNLLIADEGLPGWTFRLGKRFRLAKHLKNGVFEIGAAMPFMTLSRELSEGGYSGLEFAGGIPAMFGGAVFMNAGAHAGEVSNILESVKLVDSEGRVQVIDRKDLKFSYRKSYFPADSIVLGGTLALVSGSKEKIIATRNEFLAERKKRQPLTLPSAGSVFKNVTGQQAQTAGSLIEKAGLKGRAIGGAKISELHANWIVNPEKKASAKDVLELISICKQGVMEKFSLELEPELIFWG